MHSKKSGRITRYATLALAILVISNVTGCAVGKILGNLNYITSYLGTGTDILSSLGL